ncbi:hypothetical protein AB4K20DRAFT_1984600 [Rhizopus microsporus]|uniref:Uncharacterized protein n=1 Tax=Rhizopus microsporus TaxID=58291 RepID=A0A1X0S699_RHIZD|nr:hypothetical protein BCV71DRAFT_282175 [Rhizopus microsporus]
MECKNEKARLYESMFPSEDTVYMYQCSKTTHLSDSLGNMTFYGVDPGVRTIATCVHPDLPSFFKTEEGKARLHHLIKPYETTVTAKSISAKSRTSYHRFKLQKRKNSNSDITSIESKLAQMINTTKVRSSKYLLIKKHQLYKETRDKMLEFYCYSSWTRRKNRGQRFKDKAYSSSARKIIRNADSEGNVVFYGDFGRRHGLWIKGYEKRSTDILQKSLSSRSTVISTTK